MTLVEYPDSELMMISLADRLASEVREALNISARASIAVPGGTTPGPIFDVLAATHLDWARVDVMLTDERWVPETSDRSNTRLLRQRLLTGPAAAARLIPLLADTPAPEDALESLGAAVADCLPLDVCLLGMGTDLHIASIFPGADRLEDALHGAAPLVAMRAPGAPEPRVTLSAGVLQGAIRCHIVIRGQDKRDALDAARGCSLAEAPVLAVLAGATVHWARD